MINHRPWGTYQILLDEPTYKVKRIIILPHQQLSLQYHNYREEHWTVVRGSGIIRIGNEEKEATVGSRWVIPLKEIHRARAGSDHLVFIETQLGECLEDDIIRLEDQYGRLEKGLDHVKSKM